MFARGALAAGLILALATGSAVAAPMSTPPPPPPPIGSPSVVRSPDWTKLPSGDQFLEFYPDRAQRMGIEGRVVLECDVAADGTLQGCAIQSETPPDQGFGDAALKLAALFKMRPLTRDGQSTAGGRVTIPIRFRMPVDTSPPSPPANAAPSP